jgi:catechol 2,3-dioxygenase-like lactoylglutathione lyase family enzyme
MTVQRMDHVGIVVEDLDAAIAFFTELGLEAQDRMKVHDAWVDRVVGLAGVNVEITMMRTPDGHSRLELTKFLAPAVLTGDPYPAPANVLGLRRIMFAVDDIRDVVRRLEQHGGELIGEIAQYEDVYLLCYLRGPSGIIVALAESLG